MGILRFARVYVVPDLFKIKGSVGFSVFLLLLTTFSQIASIEAARSLIQVLQIKLAGAVPTGFAALLMERYHLTDSLLFLYCAVVAVVLPLITYLFMYARDITLENMSIKITRLFQDRIYSQALGMPYTTFRSFRVPALVKRINYDVNQIRRLVLDVGMFRIADVIVLAGVLIYLAILDPILTVIAMLTLGLYVIVAWISARMAAERIRQVDVSREEIVGYAQESFERFLDIRANLREKYESGRFSDITRRAAGRRKRFAVVLLLDKCLTNFLSAVGPVTVMVAGGVLVMRGTIPLETLMAFVAATSMLYGPVDKLSAIPMDLKELQVSINNMEDIFRCPAEEDQVPPAEMPGPADAGQLLSIRDLDFEFPDARRRFRFRQLDIGEKERVALVGPSGSGKTTLLLLLFRVYGNYSGGIYFQGKEISTIPLAELRARMALMLQDNYIFADTIARNVGYGAPDRREISYDEIMPALEKAGLAAEVMRMPKGPDTLLDHMGTNISGGQRRRLCLSRAVVKEPKLLLLDEPLTGVPPMEVEAIIDALTQEKLDTALIISTHQGEILKSMDRIIVLNVLSDDDGYTTTVIEAAGTHDHLLKTSSFYRKHFGDGDSAPSPPAGGKDARQEG